MFKLLILAAFVFLSSADGDADGELAVIVGEYWDWFLGEYPEFAREIEDSRFNSQLENYTLAAVAKRKTDAEVFFNRLEVLGDRREALSASSRISYDVLRSSLQTFIDGYEYVRSPQSLNPISYKHGPQLETSALLGTVPFENKKDYLDYLTRLSKTKHQIGEMMELARLAIKLGRTLHAVSMEPVPAQIDRILRKNATELIIYNPFTEFMDDIESLTPAEKKELRAEAIRIINDDFLPSFRQLKKFIVEEYLPNTRSEYGVSSWREDFYPALLKWYLSAEETPTVIHNMGLTEVARIRMKMSQSIERQGLGSLSIPDYFTYLRRNSTFQMSSVEGILDTYTYMIDERINPNLSRMFKNNPNLPVVVSINPFAGRGSYSWVSADGSRPGVFMVNPFPPNNTFVYDMLALVAHEANPGHHLQVSYALQIPSPPFRKHLPYRIYNAPSSFPGYTAYAEGWALYAESLVEEMGIYKDDIELMGRYSSEMYRACRLVVDTGIHAMGWSREKAILYMLKYTSLLRVEVEEEVDRYITWPGQACAYKYGEFKFKELRKRAKNKLGERFDIKDFHSTVLDLGRVPLSVMETAVDDWIDITLRTPLNGSSIGPSSSTCLLIVTLTAITFKLS